MGNLALSEVVIPDSVISIDAYAFTRCRALASVSIPSKVTSIGEGAFYNAGLKSVVIGKGVTSISKMAF
ncbi:MAG: leucine-rich repeat domain-containing protein [Bacilli bacterium]|nr:leucine-rich repeat domain-containing protein [Bacilli bacterium]